MSSWELGLAGICGLLAWGIASFALRKRTRRRWLAIPLALVLFAFAKPHFVPKPTQPGAGRPSEADSKVNRLFQLVATRHPDIDINIHSVESDARRNGKDVEAAKNQAIAAGGKKLWALIGQYAPIASDESLRVLGVAMVDLLREYESLPDDTCARAVRQDSSRPLPGASPALEGRMHDAMFLVFDSAFNHPIHPPSDAELQDAFTSWNNERADRRGKQYVEEAANLKAAATLNVEQSRRLCALAIDVYQDALAAPPDTRSKVLRAIFSSKVGTE